jgi:23S rRNA (cytosine1962-C5)-methyltransferase
VRSSTGGGEWSFRRPLPESWTLDWAGERWRIQPTGFGHVGLFPEQMPFWRWIRQQCADALRMPPDAARATAPSSTGMQSGSAPGAPAPHVEVLNLFAYTGGSSLAAARGGASVTHCDAARGIVAWASENARLAQLGEGSIRWIVDDAMKFVRREQRRQRRYDAVILDPPSFGRGTKGEVWKLEEHLPDLLSACAALLSEHARFVLLSAHTPGVGALALRNLLAEVLGGRTAGRPGSMGCGEMLIPEASPGAPRALPSGTWAAWAADRQLPTPESFA